MAEEISVKLRVVTPLFMGGAEPRIYLPLEASEQSRIQAAPKPELRSSSMRGALRWWLRALLAGENLSLVRDTEMLWQEEAAVFGSTNQASAVVLSTIPISMTFQPMPRPRGSAENPNGVDYLAYGMHSGKSRRDNHSYTPRQYFDEGSEFALSMKVRPGATNGIIAIEKATAALWLLMRLGGLGSRSRRGNGSIVVVPPVNIDGAPSFDAFTYQDELAKNIRDGLILLTKQDWGKKPDSVKTSSFSMLHPEYCTIVVISGQPAWRSYEDAMDNLGRTLSRFRTENHGYSLAAFGLPASIFGSVLTGKEQEEKGRGKKYDRSASPLHIKVARLLPPRGVKEREYVAVLTLFHTDLLPRRAILSNGEALPNQDIIGQFIEALKANSSFNCKMLWEPMP